MSLQVDIRQVIHSLSDALDLVGIDEVQHGKRVAFMAWECGTAMRLDPLTLEKVYHASLLHDCGVSSTQVHRSLVSELDWSGSQQHCLRGEELLKRCRLFCGLPLIIRYHHTHWQDLPADLDPEVALISNLIYLADRVDALVAQHGGIDILHARHSILEAIKKRQGVFFETKMTDAFLEVAASEVFWLMLDSRHLSRYIMEMERKSKPEVVDQKSFFEVATIFAEIVDAKSPFTVEHSLGVARLVRLLGGLAGLSADRLDMLEIAGLLHDLGKLNVPDEILEKPGPLTEEERMIMMRHSFESYQILSRMSGFEQIAQWAAYHHEALAGTGYPFHKDKKGLSLEARIIGVADVFQALAQNRPYRDALPLEKIFVIMDDMVADNTLDPQLVGLIKTHAEQCLRHAKCID
ncbi:MAG: HD domain-containing protein [Desulfobulbaceae bacterium]|nr:HD domain-containing protein [Desulfobulbaceae bacterium]